MQNVYQQILVNIEFKQKNGAIQQFKSNFLNTFLASVKNVSQSSSRAI